MTDLDRDQFVTRWHQAVAVKLGVEADPEKLRATGVSLLAKLGENPPIRRLASNPLLCGGICALHYFRNEFLPDSQRELCEALCHLLIHQREVEGGLRLDVYPEAYRTLTYNQKRSILQDFAHHMVLNETATLDLDRAGEVTAEALEAFPARTKVDADDVVTGLLERSGVVRRASTTSLDFLHNTLRDFLAAERFAKRDTGLLAGKALEASWSPVVQFAVACGDQAFATELIAKILDDGDEGEARERQIAALQCGVMAFKLDAGLQERLSSIEATLFPPRSMADAEALAVLGDPVVPFLRHRQRNARLTAACIRALRMIGTKAARTALAPYLQDQRRTVALELAQAFNPLEVRHWRDQLIAGKRLPEGIARQVTDLGPLRGLTSLQRLYLSYTGVTDLAPLTGLTSLQSLHLSYMGVTDLGPLTGLTGLWNLSLDGTGVIDIGPLTGLTSLRDLSLIGTDVTDLGPLTGLTGLEILDLRRTGVTDLSPLRGLESLQGLWIGNTGVTDLGPLTGLTNLQILDLQGTRVADISPVAHIEGLNIFGGPK